MNLGFINIFSMDDVSNVIVQLTINNNNVWLRFDSKSSVSKVEGVIEKETKLSKVEAQQIGTHFVNYTSSQYILYHTLHWFFIDEYFFRIVQAPGTPNYFLFISKNEFTKTKSKIVRYWGIMAHQSFQNPTTYNKFFHEIGLLELHQKQLFKLQWDLFVDSKLKTLINISLGVKFSDTSDLG